MTIAASCIGGAAISQQVEETQDNRKPPVRRQAIAKSDAVLQPEAR